MVRVLSFLIRYFSNYYTRHRSDLAARAAPLDPRLSPQAGDKTVRLSKINILYFYPNQPKYLTKTSSFHESPVKFTMKLPLPIPLEFSEIFHFNSLSPSKSAAFYKLLSLPLGISIDFILIFS